MRVDVSGRIAGYFPIGSELVKLEVVAGEDEDDGRDEPAAFAVIRLIIWDQRDGLLSIRDVKEQQVFMGWPVLFEDGERVAAFFAALGEVIAEIPLEEVETLMPHDLMCADALKLKRATTREDFAAALRAKSRLGQFLDS